MAISLVGSTDKVAAESSASHIEAGAFVQLVQPHLRKMLYLAERLAGAAVRDDVVQEALLNAWRKRAQFDPARGVLSAWLMAITANQARKSWRKRLLSLPAYVAAQQRSPDEIIDLERALRRLPSRQRLAIDCHYFAGLSIAETAAVMRCSQGTVKSNLFDARARLRTELEVIE